MISLTSTTPSIQTPTITLNTIPTVVPYTINSTQADCDVIDMDYECITPIDGLLKDKICCFSV